MQLRPRMEKRRHSDFSILISYVVTPLHLRTRGDELSSLSNYIIECVNSGLDVVNNTYVDVDVETRIVEYRHWTRHTRAVNIKLSTHQQEKKVFLQFPQENKAH